jgi:hypothetical protein
MASTRHALIDLARRRQRPGSGSARSFLRNRTANVEWPDLTAALAPIPWAVVGAVATRHYMPERMTRDLDVIIAVADVPAARERLLAAGYRHISELGIGGGAWQAPGGVEVDVLECAAPWCRGALAAAQTNRDGQGLPVLPLPYLVLMKLGSGRAQDVADVARMLGQAGPAALDAVRAVVREFAPPDLDDLESLVVLGRLEMRDDAG